MAGLNTGTGNVALIASETTGRGTPVCCCNNDAKDNEGGVMMVGKALMVGEQEIVFVLFKRRAFLLRGLPCASL